MRRRILLLAAVVLAAGCSDATTGPNRTLQPSKSKKDEICLSGYVTGAGDYVCTEWGEGP